MGIFKKLKEASAKKKQLKQYKEYYKVVREGLLFIKFIQEDLAGQKKDKVNRHQRRRFEKELNKEGKLTEEIVQHYKVKIDNVLAYIEIQLNPPKKPKVRKIKTSGYQPQGAKIENPKAPKGGTGEVK